MKYQHFSAIAAILGILSVVLAQTPDTSRSIQSVIQIFPNKPADYTPEEWQALLTLFIEKYKVPQPQHDVLLLRVASRWKLLDTGNWSVVDAVPAKVYYSNAPKEGSTTYFCQHKDPPGYSQVRLWIEQDVTTALGQCITVSSRRLGNATRLSTWYGNIKPISIEKCDFVAHFNDAPGNYMYVSFANVWMSFQMSGEEAGKHVNLAQVTSLCERLTALVCDAPEADNVLRRASQDQLSLRLKRNDDGSVMIYWDTPTGSKLDQYWIKIKTSNGKLSIKGTNKVELVGASSDGAIVNCYAISPDGKDWYSTSIQVPSQATSQPAG